MSYPKTKEEWWDLLDRNHEAIRNLVVKFHPCSGLEVKREYAITAPGAEAMCQAIRREITARRFDPVGDFDVAVAERDGRGLVHILTDVWFSMPESESVRDETGFHVLCDLCSECDLLYEEEKGTMEDFWNLQAEWSRSVFGPDDVRGPQGPLKHLVKEVEKELLPEIQSGSSKGDLEEYADLVFLVVDSTRRAGYTYPQLLEMCFTKLEKNRNRKWNTTSLDEPVEHVRE